MPLHLLGKKSWNVYNADNIARVRRDEAEAKAKEEAEELRMQEAAAKRRLAILRGEVPPPIEDLLPDEPRRESDRPRDAAAELLHPRERKKRKRHDEDDTDFELRVARERVSQEVVPYQGKAASSAPLVGRDGHLDLIGDERAYRHAEKNEEAERESAAKRREYEDQFTMRFSNAAGKSGLGDPWYSAKEGSGTLSTPGKDVWGNEDPMRKQRDAKRLVSNDPLAMMKAGAARVREVRKARESVQKEREEELRRMRKEDRRRERHERRDERKSRHRDDDRRRSEGRQRHRSRSERRNDDRGRRRRSLSPCSSERRDKDRERGSRRERLTPADDG